MSGLQEGRFWSEFVTRSAALGEYIRAGQMREAFDAVEALLQTHGFDFAFELTEDGDVATLVLTPEGDKEVARRIDDLLVHHPPVPGWKFVGRRQRKRFQDALTFVRHIYDRDASDTVFEVRENDTGYDVTVITRAVEGLQPDEAYGLAVTLLDHSLGEDVVMSRVSAIHAVPAQSRSEGRALSPLELISRVVGH